MKKDYKMPKAIVKSTRIKASLLAGSGNEITVNPFKRPDASDGSNRLPR